jgi:hypothetical protein
MVMKFKLSQDATLKRTIIAIIGKISPIIVCALVPEGLDLRMPFGLGTQGSALVLEH